MRMPVGAASLIFVTFLSACTSPAPAASASTANACINPSEITKQTIVSDQEIQFEMRNGDVWVNKLPRVCSGLKFEQGFSWDVRGMQVCSNEQIIEVKNAGNSCMLGAFSRMPKPAT